jgi:polysaccharide deacetylase family protein (PEP-CTERM system associated)
MTRSIAVVDAASSALTGERGLKALFPGDTTAAPPSHLRSHVLTVALEDYYHAASFRPWIRQDTYYRFENRLVESTKKALDLLDRCSARATFFVDRWTATSAPELVREVSHRGHEIASRGDHAGSPRELGPKRFREHAIRCREQLEEVVGLRVLGFRLAGNQLIPGELWMLDVLAECGYLYDSSIGPALGANATKLLRRYHRQKARLSHGLLHEVPVSSMAVFGVEVPIADGGSLRRFPGTWMRKAVEHWHRNRSGPYVMNFRTWELDAGQPRINAGPVVARIWHYRNLDQMPALLEQFLTPYGFTTVAEHLGLELASQRSSVEPASSAPHTMTLQGKPELNPAALRRTTSAGPMPVTIVIPCFNESQSLGYLNNTLRSVASTFCDDYAFTFVFVDDGSTDGTWAVLQQLFGARSDCRLIQHDRNQGLARTIQTGISHAHTPIVCSIDCDCTYDPHLLARMIPLLADGVDLVTASPYHPQGAVKNVPPWRLLLSKSLSQLYRMVLRQKLHTYTSCFRVYRREAAMRISVRRGGFFGVTEMLGRLDFQGGRIVEFPATLEVRMLGRSSMKILPTVAGHLKLLTHFAGLRLKGRNSRANTVPPYANE